MWRGGGEGGGWGSGEGRGCVEGEGGGVGGGHMGVEGGGGWMCVGAVVHCRRRAVLCVRSAHGS